jgi:Ni/Co efflux regulator RcnB
MHKMLLASAACLALLTTAALADKDHDKGNGPHHDQGAPPTNSQMAPAATNGGGNGHHGSGNANNNGRHHDQASPANNPMVPAATNGGGRNNGGWNASNNGPGNNWSGKPGSNNGWHGGNNAGWQGGNSWRNDRASWTRYHRSWNATRRYRWTGSYVRPAGWSYRRWTLGAFVPALYFTQQYWIPNYVIFALDPQPPGTVWVRYGSDALLVDRYSGEVIQVVYGIFY